jgi:hypothetical protein
MRIGRNVMSARITTGEGQASMDWDPSEHAAHRAAINDLLTRFFQSFDQGDWALMRSCLSEQVFADYSSFRETPAATLPADDYVEQRRTALRELRMQHNFVNLRVEVESNGKTASARCNYMIYRFHPSYDGLNDHYFHSFGWYAFGFARTAGVWRISHITQHLLRNVGRRELHGATRERDEARARTTSESDPAH